MNGSSGPGPRPGTETQATAIRRSRKCPVAANDKQVKKKKKINKINKCPLCRPLPARRIGSASVIICGIICGVIASFVYRPLKITMSARSYGV